MVPEASTRQLQSPASLLNVTVVLKSCTMIFLIIALVVMGVRLAKTWPSTVVVMSK